MYQTGDKDLNSIYKIIPMSCPHCGGSMPIWRNGNSSYVKNGIHVLDYCCSFCSKPITVEYTEALDSILHLPNVNESIKEKESQVDDGISVPEKEQNSQLDNNRTDVSFDTSKTVLSTSVPGDKAVSVSIPQKDEKVELSETIKKYTELYERGQREWERAVERVHDLCKTNVQVYSSNASKHLMDILSGAKEASEKYYANSCNIVREINAFFLPQKETISSFTICEIIDIISRINEECAVTYHYDIKIDGVDYGNMASVKFSTPMDCKSIESAWKLALDMRKDCFEAKQDFKKRVTDPKKQAEREAEKREREYKEREREEQKSLEEESLLRLLAEDRMWRKDQIIGIALSSYSRAEAIELLDRLEKEGKIAHYTSTGPDHYECYCAANILETRVKSDKAWFKDTNSTKVGGCYVATAVYGSYDCPEVWTLRRYRDYKLAKCWYGKVFIKVYYTLSPTIVKWFGDTKWFNRIWKKKLDYMVTSLMEKGYESTPYMDKM